MIFIETNDNKSHIQTQPIDKLEANSLNQLFLIK